ncbi:MULTISPECIES: ligand-binding sensor domain-containing protein [Chitinophagaceae]
MLFPLLLSIFSSLRAQNSLSDSSLRFDGKYYQLLSGYDVRGAEMDGKGRLWLATSTGLLFFDGNSVFKPVKELAGSNMLHISKDPVADRLWVRTINTFGILDLRTFQYRVLKKISLKDEQQSAVVKMDKGRVATVFPDHTFSMYRSDGTLELTIPLDTLLSGENASGFALCGDSIYFSRRAYFPYIVAYNVLSGKYKVHSIKNNKVHWLKDIEMLDSRHLIFTDEQNGFHYVDIQDAYRMVDNPLLDSLNAANKRRAYGFQRWNSETLSLIYSNGNIVNFTFKSKQQYLTPLCSVPDILPHIYRPFLKNMPHGAELLFNHDGLFLMRRFNPGFSSMLVRNRNKISTRNIFVDSLGSIYVGSYQGLFCYDKKSSKWTQYNTYFPGKRKKDIAIPVALYPDGQFLYLGSDSYPFYRFDMKTKAFQTDFYRHPDFVTNSLWNIGVICPVKGTRRLLLGYSQGLAYYDMDVHTLEIVHNEDWRRLSNSVWVIRYLRGDIYLLGTKLGLFELNTKTLQVRHVVASQDESINDILSLPEQKEIWLGTATKGIMVLDNFYHLKRVIESKDGLSHTPIAGLAEGTNGNIWISTNNGLSCYKEGRLVNYFKEDGLAEDGFNRFSYFTDHKGNIYLGSINGISIINEKKLSLPVRDEIFVSQISIWRHRILTDEIFSVNRLPLDNYLIIHPHDGSLVFNLGTTCLSNVGNISYEFRIKEISTKWQPIGKGNILRFDGLPYGLLHVEIRSINRNNLRSANVLLYTLEVQQPFYKSELFYILLTLLVIGLTKAFLYQRSWTSKQLHRQRLTIAQTLHDEVGSLFTAIRFRIENITSKEVCQPQDLHSIYSLFQDASTAIYETLWLMDSNKDTGENLVNKFREINEMVLEPANAHLDIQLRVASHSLSPLMRQQLYYIYKEAVNNIAKHSIAPHVHIIIEIQHNRIWLLFRNNNVRNTMIQSNHMGLASIRRRAETIGCTVTHDMMDGNFTLLIKTAKSYVKVK